MSYSHSCRLYSSSTFYPTSTPSSLFSCRLYSSSSTFYPTPQPFCNYRDVLDSLETNPDAPPAPPLPPSSPPLPPSSPPLPPPPSPSSLQPQRKRRKTPAEEIHTLYQTNTGTKKLDAIKSTVGYCTSTFYEWKPLAEVKIIEA